MTGECGGQVQRQRHYNFWAKKGGRGQNLKGPRQVQKYVPTQTYNEDVHPLYVKKKLKKSFITLTTGKCGSQVQRQRCQNFWQRKEGESKT